MCRLGWGSVRQRGGCPSLRQWSGAWTLPALCRDSPITPEMQSQFISHEVGVMLLSERFPGGRDLPAWRYCLKT